MANHKLFIAWAFNRHCSVPHNADFEVCQDNACVRARGYENAMSKTQAMIHEMKAAYDWIKAWCGLMTR